MVANAHERLGPAERIIQALVGYTDHMVHNRPGIVTAAPGPVTKRWQYAKRIGTACVLQVKGGKKTIGQKLGEIGPDNIVRDGARVVGEFREAGIFKEVAVWMYRQVAEVWKVDNEFAARWASYQYALENRDLKTVLAAFMLVQSRKGDPVRDGGSVLFLDDDFRDVGVAMMLGPTGGPKGREMDPKQLLRIHRLLSMPEIVAINRELGFGSGRGVPMGRWEKAVQKWLYHRETNPKLLTGLIKSGQRGMVRRLATLSHYKPTTAGFCQALRWKQVQAKEGHRTIGLGMVIEAAETWEGLTEEQVCERIVAGKLSWKSVVPRIPASLGVTKAMVVASLESGGFSDKEVVIFGPTLESLGLLEDPAVKARFDKALAAADDMRAANVARRMQNQETKAQMEAAAEKVVQKAVDQVMRNIRVKVIVDRSGSMERALAEAIDLTAQLVQGFPLDRVHVAVFSSVGRELTIKDRSAAGVKHAFHGIRADGGTDHSTGVQALRHRVAQADEDMVYIFIGDEEETAERGATERIRRHLAADRPVAFGLVHVGAEGVGRDYIQRTAADLGIPCFRINKETFSDPYAIPRTMRALIQATPVGLSTAPAAPRVALAEVILKTELLKRPAWAA